MQARPKFSIMGDGEESSGGVEDDGTLIEFDATPQTPEPALLKQPSASSSSSSAHPSAMAISDEDLLQELEAAEKASSTVALTLPRPPTDGTSGATTAVTPGAESRSDGGGGGGAGGAPKPGSGKVDHLAELSALEELEKELGLDIGNGGKAGGEVGASPGLGTPAEFSGLGGGSAGAAVDLGGLDFEENLDEFEGFLKSLEKGGAAT